MSLVQFRPEAYADLAHLVERNLAKVEVAGPSPVIRLETETEKSRLFFFFAKNEAKAALLCHSERSEESTFFFKETKAAPL